MGSDSTAGHDGFLDLAGLRFHYCEWGSTTASPIVLLHGFGLSARAYDHIAQHLSTSHRVIAFDQRGHGETDWATDYSWERWVEDVERFADALDLPSFDLVGHSMGGAVATRFTGLHPNRVQHLVLLDPQHVDMVLSPEWADFGSRVAEINRPDGYASREDYVTTIMSLFPRAERPLIEVRSSMLTPDDSGRFRMPWTTDPSMSGMDPSEAEEKKMRRSVTCPTLVAQAEYSEFHIPDANVRLAAEFPQGEPGIINGAGHNLAYEQTEATIKLINEFITR